MTTINTYPKITFLLKIIVLLMIIFKCKMLNRFIQANRSTISYLLKNLAVKDESSLNIIGTGFFVHYQKSITDILELLIGSCVKLKQPMAEWIFAVPLLHFVTKRCQPYEQLEGITWDDNLIRRVD